MANGLRELLLRHRTMAQASSRIRSPDFRRGRRMPALFALDRRLAPQRARGRRNRRREDSRRRRHPVAAGLGQSRRGASFKTGEIFDIARDERRPASFVRLRHPQLRRTANSRGWNLDSPARTGAAISEPAAAARSVLRVPAESSRSACRARSRSTWDGPAAAHAALGRRSHRRRKKISKTSGGSPHERRRERAAISRPSAMRRRAIIPAWAANARRWRA